jgi:hypothetical protein
VRLRPVVFEHHEPGHPDNLLQLVSGKTGLRTGGPGW